MFSYKNSTATQNAKQKFENLPTQSKRKMSGKMSMDITP